jgi:hypothetical protein
MLCTCANRVLLLAALATLGCEARRLDLALSLASDSCTQTVPAGGSFLYQMSAEGIDVDGSSLSFCGACLPVDTALTTPDAMVAFLRDSAPSCPGVHPSSTLAVKLTAFDVPMCPPSRPLFCSESPTVPLPDGTQDAVVPLVLTCDSSCNGVCVPTTCAALGKNCGKVSNGCGGTLQCGNCMPANKCSAGGIPNVCAK